MWVEEPKSGGWGEQPITPPSWGTKPKTPTGGPGGPVGWAEPEMDLQGWGHQNKVSVDMGWRDLRCGLQGLQ